MVKLIPWERMIWSCWNGLPVWLLLVCDPRKIGPVATITCIFFSGNRYSMANTHLNAAFILILLQTSSILSSFFLAMTLNPEVQIQARENIDSVLGPNNLPTFADRERLPYIDCIIKELIRWHPPAPLSTICLPFACSKLMSILFSWALLGYWRRCQRVHRTGRILRCRQHMVRSYANNILDDD